MPTPGTCSPYQPWLLTLLLLVSPGCDFGKTRGVPDSAYEEVGGPGDRVEVAACASPCPTIRLDTLYTIGDPADANLLIQTSHVRAGSGFVSTWGWVDHGPIPLFDLETGEFQGTVGRWGGGPGEFQAAKPFEGPGGELWLVDPANTRVSIVGREGEVRREFPFAASLWSIAPLDSGRFAMTGVLPIADGTPSRGRPLAHVFDTLGNHLWSFGPRLGSDYHALAKVRMTGAGNALISHRNVYRIEEWTLDDQLVRVLDRPVDWFRPWHQYDYRTDTALEQLIPDPDGRHVWVLLRVSYDDIPPLKELKRLQREEGLDGWDIEEIVRFRRIEVIDLQVARVVAQRDFDRRAIWALHHGLLVAEPMTYATGEAGYVISRMRLEMSPGGDEEAGAATTNR